MVPYPNRRPAFALLASLVLVGGITATMSALRDDDGGDSGLEEANTVPPVAGTSDAVILLRIGLGADLLAAAGVQSGEVSDLAASALTADATAVASLRDLDQARAEALASRDALRRKVRSGLASAEEITQLATAKGDLAAAEAARDLHMQAMRTAAMASLDSTERATLDTMWANQKKWDAIPVEFLVQDLSEADWVRLRDDLDAERIAAKESEACPSEVVSRLSACRAESDVATASVNLDTYHASVQTAWNSAVE